MINTLKNKWSNFSSNDLELLRLINEITHNNSCPYFLIGAKARDILLEYFGKNEAQRATLDTDIAISCKNWDAFYKIKNAFINNGAFFADDKHEHRVLSKYGDLDIIPFGNIKDDGSNITWPPEYDVGFSLIGFDDAYKSAMDININDIIVTVTSPSGFAVLKLFAWLSRKTQKDASDFAYFISNYFDFGNQERFFEEHHDLLQKNFDYTLSGCRLLGRDLKSLSSETKIRLKEFFDNEQFVDHLAIAIAQSRFSYDSALAMIHMISEGFND